MPYLTYQDSIDHLVRYTGAGPSSVVLTDVMEAVGFAYRELYNAHTWTYYYKHGRINTVSPYTSGTIQYDVPSNTVTLTTTDGTSFPEWSIYAYLRVGTAIYKVATNPTPTTLTLDAVLQPTEDLAAGTPYILYRDSYFLPTDFLAGDQGMYENCFGPLTYTHPREWLWTQRYIYQSGMPQAFTITGDPYWPMQLLIRLFPIPVDSRTLDYIYKRAPRQLIYSNVTAGNVTITAGTSNTSVANIGSAISSSAGVFTPSMVGSVVRVSSTTNIPTAPTAIYPAAYEDTIATVQSPGAAVLTNVSPFSYNTAVYIISDPIDVEQQSMSTAFFRACEMMIGMARIMKDKPDARAQYTEAVATAKEKDSRHFGKRAVGDGWRHRQQMKDMPLVLYPTYSGGQT